MADATTERSEKRARRDAYVAARADAKGRLQSGDIETAVELLDSPWSGVRSMAVRALRKNGWASDALPSLVVRSAREGDDSVRLSIVLALRDLEDPRAAETLWSLFEKGPDDVRMAALQGLSLLGDEQVIPIAVSWYHSRGRSLTERGMPHAAVFDLVLLQTSSGDKAVADLLSSEKTWRRRRLIRRAKQRAERWLGQRS